MSIAKVFSATFIGLNTFLIDVEVDLTPCDRSSFVVVGLPDAAVRESKDRVLATLKNCGYKLDTHRLIINLAPSNIRKEGTFYDLPIALGVIHAFKALPEIENYLILGELGLDGEVRPIRGTLPMAILAHQLKMKGVILPKENCKEASLIEGIDIVGVSHIKEALHFFYDPKKHVKFCFTPSVESDKSCPDFAEIKGQYHIKRAMEIAAAGGHNMLLSGPPGSGKTLLAKAFPSLLPKLTLQESLEVTKIYSIAGVLPTHGNLLTVPPFRSPHHTISYAGMIGGGSAPRPGEVSLAHNGVLFLDELSEFSRLTLEALRQPLEDKMITISRAKDAVSYPTKFIFIGAMNPCPCGYLGHPIKPCKDSELQITKYKRKISGPLLDRIDMHLISFAVKYDELFSSLDEECSASVAERVAKCRQIQYQRQGNKINGELSGKELKTNLAKSCLNLIKQTLEENLISARSLHRLLKVSRTIADLTGKKDIEEDHLLEAISYRITN